jgi:hypothetical protein
MFRIASALKNIDFALKSSSNNSELIPSFYTEVLTDSILLYDANNTFVAQANTIEELIIIAYEKYNLPELHIKHNDKTLYINEGKIASL